MKKVLFLVIVLALLVNAAPVLAGNGKLSPAGSPPGGAPKAGADKAPLYNSNGYTCEGGATATSSPEYGFVIVSTNAKGNLIVQVSLRGATSNATYSIWVNQYPGGCPLSGPSGSLTTNKQGNGNAHLEVARLAGATKFWVSAVGGGQTLRSTAVQPKGIPKAGAGKASLYDSVPYTCESGATTTSGPAYGFVVLNTNADGDLIVQVSLKRAMPNATYNIWVNQHPGACPLSVPTASGALTTNRQGNGNAHLEIPRFAGATKFWVSVVGDGQTLRSTAVQLD